MTQDLDGAAPLVAKTSPPDTLALRTTTCQCLTCTIDRTAFLSTIRSACRVRVGACTCVASNERRFRETRFWCTSARVLFGCYRCQVPPPSHTHHHHDQHHQPTSPSPSPDLLPQVQDLSTVHQPPGRPIGQPSLCIDALQPARNKQHPGTGCCSMLRGQLDVQQQHLSVARLRNSSRLCRPRGSPFLTAIQMWPIRPGVPPRPSVRPKRPGP